jgi:hypothetical protein
MNIVGRHHTNSDEGYLMLRKTLCLTFVSIMALSASATVFARGTAAAESIDQSQILRNTPGLSSDALKHAVNGYEWAVSKGRVNNPDILTIVDFTKPSYENRLWVIDLKRSKPIMSLKTTHGKNSGGVMATSFSNRGGSDESSLGVYTTMNAYSGKHGLSERLQGLEPGVNNNAYSRAIVVHPASYAAESYVNAYHQAGRSWGCFAVDPSKSSKLVNLTKNGTVLFAYAKPENHDPIVA